MRSTSFHRSTGRATVDVPSTVGGVGHGRDVSRFTGSAREKRAPAILAGPSSRLAGAGHVAASLRRGERAVVEFAVPVYVVDSELWWVGLIGRFLLAVAVEATINEALKRWYVPEPALAACLVAGVTAVALLGIYVIVRFVLRFRPLMIVSAPNVLV